jgi:hypothetical protein
MHEEPFYAHFITKQIYSSVQAANEHQTQQSIVKREFKLYAVSHLKLVLPTLIWKLPDKDIHSLVCVCGCKGQLDTIHILKPYFHNDKFNIISKKYITDPVCRQVKIP